MEEGRRGDGSVSRDVGSPVRHGKLGGMTGGRGRGRIDPGKLSSLHPLERCNETAGGRSGHCIGPSFKKSIAVMLRHYRISSEPYRVGIHSQVSDMEDRNVVLVPAQEKADKWFSICCPAGLYDRYRETSGRSTRSWYREAQITDPTTPGAQDP